MKYYHATSNENMRKIMEEKRIRKSFDGVVFLCREPIDSCKFLVLRGMRKVSVIEVQLDEKNVEESYDHSESFFQCKAYMHHGDIELKGNEKIYEYELDI